MPAFRKIVLYGSYLALGIAVIGAILGYIFAGRNGVVSALIGTVDGRGLPGRSPPSAS